MRGRIVRGVLIALTAWLIGLGAAAGVAAQEITSPEAELAARYAPVIVLQQQSSRCDTVGEAFLPAPVEVIFADNEVTLREGPQQIAAKTPVQNPDLFNLGSEFATDLPGSPREPDCEYEKHFRVVMGDRRPVIYAHIATEDGKPGIALQYWFFYYFNQFNNQHEGD